MMTTDKGEVVGLEFPGIDDITQRLHFSPERGRIWLDNQRMVLVHTEAMSSFREELCAVVGEDTARSLIMRMGYIAGCRDAEFAKSARSGASLYEAFAVGPQLHALKGMAEIDMQDFHIDLERGELFGEFLFKDSFEDAASTQENTSPRSGRCWMLVGYASGFATTFMGKQIVVKEIECRCQGHPHCRAQARPASEWPDAEELLHYLQPSGAQAGLKAGASTAARKIVEPPELDIPPAGQPVGASTAFTAIFHLVNRVADTRATVLLLGESGVGKSLIARQVHERSRRHGAPLISVNCAALPDTLMEAELFGVEKGAYTGATASRPGRFELADKGTLFLDEIATLSLTAQGKLLRVLQTGEYERLGSTETQRVDVRVIAATNADLSEEIKARRFREDLYYRVNVFPIAIAPLRERRDDIPPLVGYFLNRFSRIHERHVPGLTPEAHAALLAYSWPGNVRELENVIERGVILADAEEPLSRSQLFLGPETLPEEQLLHVSRSGALLADDMEELTNTHPLVTLLLETLKTKNGQSLPMLWDQALQAMLAHCDGNVSRAATMLGISRAQLDYRLKKIRTSEKA